MADYSDRIVDHFTNPRNIGELPECNLQAHIGNPICGDQIFLYAQLDDGRIADCRFLAYGCAASIATASILTEEIRNLSMSEVSAFDEAHIVKLVGGLTPTQRHCATLGRDVLAALVEEHRRMCELSRGGLE